jgi:hypothetical protein
MMRVKAIAACSAAVIASAVAISGDAGEQFVALNRNIRTCIDKQAAIVSKKSVDLETATVSVIARCRYETGALRAFLYGGGMPNFVPSLDFWEREMEPGFLKVAREVVALERTK